MRTYDEDDDQYMVNNGMVLQKIPPEDLRIDPSLIPDHVRDDLAAATLDFVCRVMPDSEIRENVAARKWTKKTCNRNRNCNFRFKKAVFRYQKPVFRLKNAVF